MGHDSDTPQRGWHHWVSFHGQGNYFPDLPTGHKSILNIKGQRAARTTYITDQLTDCVRRRPKVTSAQASHRLDHLSS
jgi:N-acetylglucosamine-6-sulfatase